ncbi:MAG: hypothetical protein H7Y41_07695, partial [Hyphomonadaceae bacterium]|nr:hypothetical protein [Clostridia bacterium]
VHIIDSNPKAFVLEHLNLTVHAVGFSQTTQYQSMVTSIQKNDKTAYNILVTHGTMDAIGECEYHPISSQSLKAKQFNYVALGHVHAYKTFENGTVAYAGSPEPFGFDEPGEHGVIVGEISEDGTLSTAFTPLQKRSCITHTCDVTGVSTFEALETLLHAVSTFKDNLVKIVLIGKRDKTLELDLPLLTGRLIECFFVRIEDQTTLSIDLDEIVNQQNLMGIFARKMLEKIANTKQPGEKAMLEQALLFGLEALQN